MYKKLNILATVCARGGSKGVKNKNIRALAGKPLIQYTLDLLKRSALIDDYVISTDSDKIISIAKKLGFKVLFKRPAALAGDKVSRMDAIKHAALWMEKHRGRKADIIVDLGVATPLKNKQDLDNCIKMLVDKRASNVFSAAPTARNPYYNMVEVVKGRISIVKKPAGKLVDRRDAPPVYGMNDGILVWRRNVLFGKDPFFGKNARLYVMPMERSVDIDEEFDFLLAEMLLKKGGARP
jgi:CMP-N,N'-diacetyllegionaminic acid synthase